MKINEKLKAIKLRKRGNSYKEILQQLKVSKSTLSLWLRDVKLSEEQTYRLYVTLRQKNAYNLAKKKQMKRQELTKQIINSGIEEFEQMTNQPIFLAGLMLYWAEGDKIETTEAVKFSNSDPLMIKLMIRWFENICKVPREKIRIALHIHELHNKNSVEKYWSKLTQIPLQQFHKTQIKPSSLKHRRNQLYYGTCSIRVDNRNLFRRIKGWKMGFQNKFNLIDFKMAP